MYLLLLSGCVSKEGLNSFSAVNENDLSELDNIEQVQSVLFLDNNILRIVYLPKNSNESWTALYDTEQKKTIENAQSDMTSYASNLFSINNGKALEHEVISPDGQFKVCTGELSVPYIDSQLFDTKEDWLTAYNQAYSEAEQETGIPYGVVSVYNISTNELWYRSEPLGEPPGTVITPKLFMDDHTILCTVGDANPLWGAYFTGVALVNINDQYYKTYPVTGESVNIQSFDGTTVWAGESDGYIQENAFILDRTMRVQELSLGENIVSVQLSVDGRYLVSLEKGPYSYDTDATFRTYDLITGKEIYQISKTITRNSQIDHITVSTDGSKLAYQCDSRIYIEHELSPSDNSVSAFVTGDDELKRILMTADQLMTNDELCDMFVYLLEHGGELSEAEVGLIKMRGDYSNIWYLHHWYRELALDALHLEVLEREVVLADRSTESNNDEFAGGADYLLKVNVKDNGGSAVPLGLQEWVFQTRWPYGGFDSLIPDQLITKEEYKLRMECRQYEDSIDLIKNFRILCTAEPFQSIGDIPNDKLVHYVVNQAPKKRDDGTYGLTQAELDAAAIKLIGIEHLKPGNSPLYNPETEIYELNGGGAPHVIDYFWRVSEDINGLQLDYIDSDEPMRYTVKDGRVISAKSILAEIEGMSFGVIEGRRSE